jgi:hypothetical protein
MENLSHNHKFLEVGHSHLEADIIHATIEKVKKRTGRSGTAKGLGKFNLHGTNTSSDESNEVDVISGLDYI